MERNKKAVQMLAGATLAAVGGILSASPTMRAELSGVRAAMTLLSETIVNDVLPAGESLSSKILDLVEWYRDLPDPIRNAISNFIVIAGVVATVAVVLGTLITVLAPVFSALGTLVGVLGTVWSVITLVVSVLATILGVSTAVAAGIAVLIAAAVALAVALIFNIGGARDKVVSFLSDIWSRGKKLLGRLWDWVKSAAAGIYNALVNWLTSAKNRALALAGLLWKGVQNRLTKLRARVGQILTKIRDTIVQKITAAKDRVLELLSLGRDMAEKGKEWIRGLARGVRDRASDLVSSFKDMATRAANALKDTFNAIMPDALSIPRISVDLPDALGGGVSAGPWSIDIPQLDTGGRIASDGLAMLHAGERIMPAAQVRERGTQPTSGGGTTVEEVNITVQAMGDDATGTGRAIAREFERELSDRGA
jgi:hypothetical protein